MADYFGKIFTVFLAVLLLYIWPTSDALERQDDISYLAAFKSVTTFVDSVRNKGYISPDMYSDFEYQLSLTGNIYEIEIEHKHKRYDPIYLDPSDPTTFQNRFNVNYEAFYKEQILPVIFPNNSLPKSDDSRKYKLTVGDYFSVKVKNKNKTMAGQLRDFLNGGLGSENNTRILIPYGGMVTNEDYV